MTEQTEREVLLACYFKCHPQADFEDEDDPDAWMMECGYIPGEGICMLAGTEHCDWECPFNPCDPEGL